MGETVVFVGNVGKGPQRVYTLLRTAKITTAFGTEMKYGIDNGNTDCNLVRSDLCTKKEAFEIASILGVTFKIVKGG